ncbi:MAG TPA: sulfur carrier protein ThiS [Hyphomicrobium sp.]|nr:sulfur carrier protein ThiS [Hyphomicrobium sp.]
MDGTGIADARTITLNGEAVTTRAQTLTELVLEQSLAGLRVATAVNGYFVAESQRATTQLKTGDRIEIVSPRQGG